MTKVVLMAYPLTSSDMEFTFESFLRFLATNGADDDDDDDDDTADERAETEELLLFKFELLLRVVFDETFVELLKFLLESEPPPRFAAVEEAFIEFKDSLVLVEEKILVSLCKSLIKPVEELFVVNAWIDVPFIISLDVVVFEEELDEEVTIKLTPAVEEWEL